MAAQNFSFTGETPNNRNAEVRRVTYWSIASNVFLAIVKFIFGLLFNSMVLVADAIHSCTDLISDVGLLYSERLWRQPRDDDHPYGHGKIETIATLGISLFLVALAIGIIINAILALRNPQPHLASWLTFSAAVISILVKEFLYQWTARIGNKIRSSAVVANAWHHRSDALSSVVAAISIFIGLFWTTFRYLDEIGAIIIAVILLQVGGKMAYAAANLLIDAAPPEKLRGEIIKCAHEVAGVITAHEMRTRYVGADVYVDLHIEVLPTLTVSEGHTIASNVSAKLSDCFDEIADVVVHVEPHQA